MTTTEVVEPTGNGSRKPAPIGTLAGALAKFQGEMPSVAKKQIAKVPTKAGGEYSYSYASLADVTAAAMPILSKHGLAFFCRPEEGDRGFILRGVLAHESGETVEGLLPLYGGTNQELGSSLTYGRRYLLGALTGIVTDDDEDGAQSVSAARTAKAPARQRQAKQSPSTPPAEKVEQGPPPVADDTWTAKIADAATFDDLTVVYNEADRMNILGHMLGNETLKSRLYAKRSELNPKDTQ